MIRKATTADVSTIAQMACKLWPAHTPEEMQEEMVPLISKTDAAFFLAFSDSLAIGFAQCQLRYDYVEGTDSSPVGYVEGIFVAEGYRQQGIARQLLAACEDWARTQCCRHFASDCEIDNFQSLQFHLKAGFQEANRIICFSKNL